ncbi:NAD(P)H-dependent oxidoreductase [uncultured Tolumonas sp.]|uniref:NAD(P)H-dependent oxidoreductase n=1 Tax=uncultured Tolumonas sp. TaxID=263765 RepID=UPI002A0A8AE0|nr:NAD(P)H-dependent oxidoreductase [uncultured Tolumonas sp.]
MKTLVIVSHPYPEQSTAIKALQEAAETLSDVTVRNLESIYGNDIAAFDVNAEQAACENKDRIVFMFPVHWFNLTPMLKAYMNAVWSYGWAFGPEGIALKDKEMLVITTAGASNHTYSAEGLIQSTIEEVLTPIKASALYVGMKYLEPLAFYEAMGVSKEKLEYFKEKMTKRVTA